MSWQRGGGAAPKYRTAEHRQARAALLAAFREGDPCCLCGKPMFGPTRNLHADHSPNGEGYRGLSHARCNVVDGAKRGSARSHAVKRDW